MLNFDVRISVYKSAFDHTGTEMSLAAFMRLGKEQYYGDIIAYRTLKESIRELKAARTCYQTELDELATYIKKNKNPFGGEDTPDVVKAKADMENVRFSVAGLESRIDAASKQADAHKRKLPCATLSGRFVPTRGKSNLVEHSGFICVDIDDHYEERDSNGEMRSYTQNTAGVPELLRQLPFVLYASHSVGGVGYFALIPLGPIDEGHTHEWYFDRLKEEFQLYGIVIDRACRDVTRLRFCSYDSNPIRNAQAVPFLGQQRFVSRNERKRQEEEAKRQALIEAMRAKRRYESSSDADTFRQLDRLVDKIVGRNINTTKGYQEWSRVGLLLASALGEDGRSYFHRLSAMDKSYNHSDSDKKYDLCLKTNGGKSKIGSVFYFFAENYKVWWYKD